MGDIGLFLHTCASPLTCLSSTRRHLSHLIAPGGICRLLLDALRGHRLPVEQGPALNPGEIFWNCGYDWLLARRGEPVAVRSTIGSAKLFCYDWLFARCADGQGLHGRQRSANRAGVGYGYVPVWCGRICVCACVRASFCGVWFVWCVWGVCW